MRIEKIIPEILGPSPEIHATRRRALEAVTLAIVASGCLGITSIGRAIAGSSKRKHAIKKVDRLLGNHHLHIERAYFWAALAAYLVGDQRQPILLVDWTKVTDGFHALVAAIPIGGRAMPVYIETHGEKNLGKASVQQRFLRNLATILPAKAQPIIVSDAGFHGAFFRATLALGWNFVGRIRGLAKVRLTDDAPFIRATSLYPAATLRPWDMGVSDLYEHATSVRARLVMVRGKRKPGRRATPRNSSEQAKRESRRDPWTLATSLTDLSVEKIVAIYALRMKIEETFRDAKNPRFGWSLRHVRSGSAKRLDVLLLLASLGMIATTVIGFEAERLGLHRDYQANTVKSRVLSHFVLGLALLRHLGNGLFPDGREEWRALRVFQREIRALGMEVT